MSSASEAEIEGLYMNAKLAIPMRTTLAELGHPQQPPTPTQTDNSTAKGASSTPRSDKIDPKPLTCVSTGSVTALNKKIPHLFFPRCY